MLISFIKKGIYGYLRQDQVGIYSFFSNNNLSFRRKAITEAGGYDPGIRIAEDYDVCQKVSRAGWLLYYCPEISLGHRARKNFFSLLRQWWNYGYHLSSGYKRHHPYKRIIAWNLPEWDDESSPEPLHGASSPPGGARAGFSFPIFVFLSSFALFHLGVAAAFAAVLAGFDHALAIIAAISLMLLCAYAYPDFSALNKDGLVRALGLFVIRYWVNLIFIAAGLIGGIRAGALYVFPPIARRVHVGAPRWPGN